MPTEIDRQEAARLHADGVLFVDVLPAAEYAESHIAGAVNVPLKRLDRTTVAELDAREPVVVYCHDSR